MTLNFRAMRYVREMCFRAIISQYKCWQYSKVKMNIEREITVAYILIKRTRKKKWKMKSMCLEKSGSGELFKEEKRKVIEAFALFSSSTCASSFCVSYLLVFYLWLWWKVTLSNIIILFINTFSKNVEMKKLLHSLSSA